MCIVNVNYVECDIRGSAGPVFSLGRLEKVIRQVVVIMKLHWFLVSLLLLVMLLCCCVDVVGCFRGPLEPRGCLVSRGNAGEIFIEFWRCI